jgi:hypothetical protein
MRSCDRRKVPANLALCLLSGAFFPILATQPLHADEPSSISEFEECRAIEANARRLLCYDTIADGEVYREEKLQEVQRENFGKKEADPGLTTEELTVTIVRIQKSESRVHYFYTADGAVWKQTGRGTWSLEVPFEAEIREGMLGSYFLVTEGGKSTRVKRVD